MRFWTTMPSWIGRLRISLVAVLAATVFSFGLAAFAEEEPAGEESPPSEAAPRGQEPMTPPDAAVPHAAGEAITVTGTIEAVEKNMLGKAKSVQIVSPELGNFLIEDEGQGEELRDHVDEKVTVVGTRKVDESGKEWLIVESFEAASSPGEEESEPTGAEEEEEDQEGQAY